MMQRVAVLLCGLLGLAAIAGPTELPGAEAARGAQGWWTARSFEQAALDSDWLQMGRLGSQLLRQTGDPRPLQLAAYRFGLDGTARTQSQVDAEILAWGGLFEQSLAELRGKSVDPWTDLHLQAHILVRRLQLVQPSPERLELGQSAYEAWLAAGGGPDRESAELAREYQRLLDLTKDAKKDEIRRMIDQ